jgi:hypothetical protein
MGRIRANQNIQGGWQMTQSRKLIHNLEQVSQDIIDFIMNSKNEAELIELIIAVGNVYQQPLDSYFWWPLYSLFRTRGAEVSDLVATAKESKTGRKMLGAIVSFLEHGEWTSTSANPNLLYELMTRLPNYKLTDPNPRLSLTLDEVKALHVTFKKKAASILLAVKGDLTQKDNVLQELSHVPKRDIRRVGSELPSGSLYKKKPLQEVKKLDGEKFKDVKATLASLFENRKAQPVLGEKSKKARLVSPVVEPLSQEYVFPIEVRAESPIVGYPYVDECVMIPTPPPPPATLSAAAFVASEAKYKSANETYSVPPRKKMMMEQFDSINNLFAPKTEMVVMRETCDDNVVSQVGWVERSETQHSNKSH